MSTPLTEPTARSPRIKQPTSTPIVESAHHVLHGSLHLLQDTLIGAGTANRFYPSSLGGKLQGASGSISLNKRKQTITTKSTAAKRPVQHQTVSPATSSFTAPDREGGSTRSTQVASVTKNEMAAPSATQINRIKHNASVKKGTVKKQGQVGKIKLSLGDAAHNIWNHFMGSTSSNKSKGKARNKGRVANNGKKGIGLPPSPLNEVHEPNAGGDVGKAEKPSLRDFSSHSHEKKLENSSLHKTDDPKTVNSTNPSFLSQIFTSSPSIPLYPLLTLLLLYHLATKGAFSYRNRTKMQRKLEGMMGSKKFSVSQEELTRHLELLKERNKSKVGGGEIRGSGGDVAAGHSHGAGEVAARKRGSPTASPRGSLSGNLTSALRAISESLKQFKDEKEELIQQRRLLLHDRDCNHDEKEVHISEKKLFLKVLAEKEEECQKALVANRKLKENVEVLQSECADANDAAQNLAEMLTQTKKEKESLNKALESKKRAHADVVASLTAMEEKMKGTEAKVADLTNQNIILNNVIARLEEENNEMEKVIDEACRSGNGDVDIEEIDVAAVSSYSGVSEAESLTKDDDESINYSQELKRKEEENAKLKEERKQLQAEVDDLHEVLLKTRTELERLNGAKSEAHAHASLPQAREEPTVTDSKVGELQQLLSKTQSDLEKLTLQNQELSTNLSKIQNEQDQLTTRQTSSLQQAKKMSDLESRVKELQQLLTQKQSDLEKNRSESEEISSNLSRVQKERDALQTELATAQQENDQRADNTKNPRSNATLESMQKKNDQLHNSLADIESLYSSLRTEKIDIEKSFEVTSNRFKSLLTENESLQKSTRKDLKRVQECNKSLEEALKFISTLIAELKAEIQQANGSPPPISPAKGTESPEVVSNKTSECKLLVQNTETLLEKLMDLKQTKQQLALAIQQLVMDVTVKPDLAEEYCSSSVRIEDAGDDKAGIAVDGGATLLSPVRSNESSDSSINQPSQLSETKESASSTTSSDNNMIQQMLEKAKSTNHLSKSDKQRLVTNLENEMKGGTQQGRDKSASPTNVPLMKRLWRKNSTPHKTGR